MFSNFPSSSAIVNSFLSKMCEKVSKFIISINVISSYVNIFVRISIRSTVLACSIVERRTAPHWPVCCVPWLGVIVHAWCPVVCSTTHRSTPSCSITGCSTPICSITGCSPTSCSNAGCNTTSVHWSLYHCTLCTVNSNTTSVCTAGGSTTSRSTTGCSTKGRNTTGYRIAGCSTVGCSTTSCSIAGCSTTGYIIAGSKPTKTTGCIVGWKPRKAFTKKTLQCVLDRTIRAGIQEASMCSQSAYFLL